MLKHMGANDIVKLSINKRKSTAIIINNRFIGLQRRGIPALAGGYRVSVVSTIQKDVSPWMWCAARPDFKNPIRWFDANKPFRKKHQTILSQSKTGASMPGRLFIQ